MLDLFLANVLNLLIGFMLGVLIRNTPAAIVGYVVYSFVLSTLSLLLASFQDVVGARRSRGWTSTSPRDSSTRAG